MVGEGRELHRMRETRVARRSLIKVIRRQDGLLRNEQLEQ